MIVVEEFECPKKKIGIFDRMTRKFVASIGQLFKRGISLETKLSGLGCYSKHY